MYSVSALEWTETSGGLWESWHDPGVPLSFPVESAPSWAAMGRPGILSWTRRERNPPLELGGGNGAPLDVGRTLVLPLEWRLVCRGTSWVTARVWRTLWKFQSFGVISLETPQRNGPHLAWRGEPPRYSRVEAGALVLRRGHQGPALVASGKASPDASCLGASRDSSPVDAGA